MRPRRDADSTATRSAHAPVGLIPAKSQPGPAGSDIAVFMHAPDGTIVESRYHFALRLSSLQDDQPPNSFAHFPFSTRPRRHRTPCPLPPATTCVDQPGGGPAALSQVRSGGFRESVGGRTTRDAPIPVGTRRG